MLLKLNSERRDGCGVFIGFLMLLFVELILLDEEGIISWEIVFLPLQIFTGLLLLFFGYMVYDIIRLDCRFWKIVGFSVPFFALLGFMLLEIRMYMSKYLFIFLISTSSVFDVVATFFFFFFME